jgi:voltage-gated potassium channel
VETIDAHAGLRDRFLTFVGRHDIAWELTMAAFAVAFVVVGFAADDADARARPALDAAELALTLIFVAEFGSRFLASYDRRAYLRGHWIDLVALIPAGRGLRIFRLLRLLRLIRAFAGVGRALTHVDRLANHKGLVWLVVGWGAVMLLSATGLYIAENGVNEAVDNPLDALWWGLTTMTTVGYGDIYPKTEEGRLAAAVLMILGIGLYSAITATITSFLIVGDRGTDLAGQLERLAALHANGRLTDDEYAAAKGATLAE